MAEKMSLQEKIAAIRAGQRTDPKSDASSHVESARSDDPQSSLPASLDAASKPEETPDSSQGGLQRPMTLKEKLAAVRSGSGAPPPRTTETESATAPLNTTSPDRRKPMTVKEKLAAARSSSKAGSSSPVSPPQTAIPGSADEPTADKKATESRPDTSSGRPMSLKEKLAAARTSGADTASKKPAASRITTDESRETSANSRAASATSAGRPLSLKEKLAAARGGSAAPIEKAATGIESEPGQGRSTEARELPPLDQISRTEDLAEAMRREAAAQTRFSAPVASGGEGARGPLVLPFHAAEPARGSTLQKRNGGAGLAVVAGLTIGWLILVASLAGAGFVVLSLVGVG